LIVIKVIVTLKGIQDAVSYFCFILSWLVLCLCEREKDRERERDPEIEKIEKRARERGEIGKRERVR